MNDDTEKVAVDITMSNLDNNVETKLEGACAKIELLEKELEVQGEQLRQYYVVMMSIRVAVSDLPENWQSKPNTGFSPVECVEKIEQILEQMSIGRPVYWALTSHDKRGDTNEEITNKIRAEKGHGLVDNSDVSADSAHARERGAQVEEVFFSR